MRVDDVIQEFRTEKIQKYTQINDELCIVEYGSYKKN